MTTKLKAEDIRGDASLPGKITGGSFGNLITGAIDVPKMGCHEVCGMTFLGTSAKITTGSIDVSAIIQRQKR